MWLNEMESNLHINKHTFLLDDFYNVSLILLFTTCFRLNGFKLEQCRANVFQVYQFNHVHFITTSLYFFGVFLWFPASI